jgi:hypothetical protein
MDSLPDSGFVFWPVGCGDSTTVVVDEETVVQIDIRHAEGAEADDDPRVAIIDEVVELLPQRDGRPYLAVFGATHLDKDHILGFKELREKVTIGDLWFTPRVLWEQDQDELCEDAKDFRDEAERRINKLKTDGQVASGDRIRIIGFSDDLEKHRDIYKDLPEGAVTTPGKEFTALDGEDKSEFFRAFVHAPFKEDAEAERNRTSFALQVSLIDGETELQAMLLGDLSYEGVKKIFDRSEDETVAFDVFLAPHHCSKSVMYGADEGETENTLKQGILDRIGNAAKDGARIVSSSPPIPASDKDGANPPHRVAADHYEELVDDGHFLCTGEHPNEESPEPIVFEISDGDVTVREGTGGSTAKTSVLTGAVSTARGSAAPSQTPVGFG